MLRDCLGAAGKLRTWGQVTFLQCTDPSVIFYFLSRQKVLNLDGEGHKPSNIRTLKKNFEKRNRKHFLCISPN
jgi:hypothetical protein